MIAIKGKSIRMFMVDGNPQGILTLEVMNWTGHILSAPRTKIAELIQRPEMKKTGVYFLTGIDTDGADRQVVYIGESDNVGKRLIQHNRDETKDFWERACIITSKDQNLTKGHVRYLESRLIDITKNSGYAKLFNSNEPKIEGLPEADIADMEYFIEQIRLVLPVLGLNFLRDKPKIIKQSEENIDVSVLNTNVEDINDSPFFEINSHKVGVCALGKEIDGEFIVLEKSQTRGKWSGVHHSYEKLFNELVAENKIVIDKTTGKGDFQENISFSSPSAAAAIVLGRAANGRTEWKIKGSKKTYAEWQNDTLNKAIGTALDD